MTAQPKIAIVLGTRPEIIKMSPVIRECQRRSLDFQLIHTEQHQKYEMDRVFFEHLQLPAPLHRLGVGGGPHGRQTGLLLTRVEEVLEREHPDVVLVQGDTNSVLAGALAAAKLHISVGHVEAGLRSYDRRMPEELNRIVADHLSDRLFAPTAKAGDILLAEGVDRKKVFVTGNTIVDAVGQNLQIARERCRALERNGLEPQKYILVTAHRAENVDHRERLQELVNAIDLVARTVSMPLIYPLHPRTESKIKEFGLTIPKRIRIIPPQGFLDFLQLEAEAALVLTDSGGIQEEACILGVPCVTLRQNTERPETLSVGANVLAGTDPSQVLAGVEEMLDRSRDWSNPLGDGHSGARIVDLLLDDGTPSGYVP